MKRKTFNLQLWRYVLDSSSLINIQREKGIRILEKRKGAILISEKVAYEVAYDPRVKKTDPLRQFVLDNPQMITQFQDNEGEEYLRILQQQGIDPGEASVMAIAFRRKLSLVVDERNTKATGKANNHGIKTLNWQDFLEGKHVKQ